MDSLTEQILNGKLKLTDSEVFNSVVNLRPNLLMNLIRNLDEDNIKIILNNKEILNQDNNFLKIVLLNSNDNIKSMMIENNDIFNKLLLTKENPALKSWFELINLDLKIKVLQQKKTLEKIDNTLFYNFVSKIKDEEVEQVGTVLGHNLIFANDDSIRHYIKEKFNLDRQKSRVKKIINDKFLKNKQLTYFLFRINTFEQLYIYSKFNLLINLKQDKKNIIFPDNSCLEFKLLKELNARHVNLLINIMKKTKGKYENHHLLINAIKLYSIFGYDNAKKILDNKFTYMTEQALDKTMEDLITDKRRQYRIENQEKFFTNKMMDKVLSFDKKYLMDLLECDSEYADLVINNIKEDEASAIKIIQKEINKREKNIKTRLKAESIKIYNNQHPNKKEPLTVMEIFKLLYNVEIRKVLINNNGHAIQDELLQKFLLGNGKVDNDCLLRRVINKCAYGLNNTIDVVVNNFDTLKEIVINSNGKLSIYSLLDVIDIVKVMIFEIPPNELDLKLESVTKLLNSRTFIDAPKEDILLRARELHLERRKKYYSSIPIVKKETDKYTYEVIKFDDPDLITIGIDASSCFKIGGGGEDLLRYCMTDPNGAIIRVYDEYKNMFMSPVVRNGNTLFINGVDPMVTSKEQSEFVMKVFKECVKDIISHTKEQKIEMAVITNLNQTKYVKEETYELIDINEVICVDKLIYTDYDNENKFDRFLIAKTSDNPTFKSYYPSEVFYLERNPNYFYCTNSEDDLERINLIINYINYESLSYEEDSDLKIVNYQNIKPTDFDYIIGNKDWFIAVDPNGNVINKLLPFDPRAKDEYDAQLKDVVSNHAKRRV
jgi:hypothetical protein